MVKYHSVVKLLEEQIHHGDYMIKDFPSERKLAQEIGISYNTARRVANILVEKGLLERKENGRLDTAQSSQQNLQVAYISPAFSSMLYYQWLGNLVSAADTFGIQVRPFQYIHNNDVIFPQILNSVDAAFLVLTCETVSDYLLELIQSSKTIVVALERDLTQHGIPSIMTRTAQAVDLLLDHLKKLGHRRLIALNTQPANEVIQERLARLNQVSREMDLNLEILNDPVKPFGNARTRAIEVMNQFLDAEPLHATAIIGVTEDNAIAIRRVLYERNISIPEDVSLCSISNEGLCPHIAPSITSTHEVDAQVYINRSLKSIVEGKWEGNLLLQPTYLRLFAGESTAAPRVNQ